jgi:hypothetical protein
MRKHIQITLDDDTADFLELARTENAPEGISRFINSLLRQERFRQGYPAYHGPHISRHPVTSWVEKIMLLRSGLLPLQPRQR